MTGAEEMAPFAKRGWRAGRLFIRPEAFLSPLGASAAIRLLTVRNDFERPPLRHVGAEGVIAALVGDGVGDVDAEIEIGDGLGTALLFVTGCDGMGSFDVDGGRWGDGCVPRNVGLQGDGIGA